MTTFCNNNVKTNLDHSIDFLLNTMLKLMVNTGKTDSVQSFVQIMRDTIVAATFGRNSVFIIGDGERKSQTEILTVTASLSAQNEMHVTSYEL